MESFIDTLAPNATAKSWGSLVSRALIEMAGDSPARTMLLIWGIYFVARCSYNLYLHPLRKIPGPRIAAATSLYDFWYDAVKGGTYLWEIRKMHETYGPIVRINPNEVHINDPAYYHHIYAGGSVRRVHKDPSTLAGFGIPDSVAATVDHAQHRQRRGYMNPYFAPRAIVSMEPLIHERITAMLARLEHAREAGEPVVSLDRVFSAMTADIITNHFFGYHYDYVSRPDLKDPVREGLRGLAETFHWTRFAPWLTPAMQALPPSVVRRVKPAAAGLLELRGSLEMNITRILRDKDAGGHPAASHSVIVEALCDARIPPKDRRLHRLVDEGQVILFAGTENSSRALAVGFFYLLRDRKLLARVRDALAPLAGIPDQELTVHSLEALPYLTGVVKESLRLSHGPVTRLPRVAAEETLHYGEYAIPPGTPVSQITYFVHMNEDIFHEPLRFDPDRWVDAARRGFPLNNYLTSFTKGSRQCLGMGLAYAEIYLTFARLLRSFEMDLVNTTIEDVQIHKAFVLGQPQIVKGRGESQGEVKVHVTAKL